MELYCTRHTDADFNETFFTHETLSDAENYAHEVTEEEGGRVEIFRLLQTIWASDEPKKNDNGVLPGIDYPATL